MASDLNRTSPPAREEQSYQNNSPEGKAPKIVCLCGSTRFKQKFIEANFRETMAGHIVLSVGCFMHHDAVPITKEEKKRLDELHLRKIDLADEVLVICPGGYTGESTKREIAYAQHHGKPIRYSPGVNP
jgi:hypothetical protein